MQQERKRRGTPYEQLPPGPTSDLGAYLYATYLKNVVPGLIKTGEVVGEFAVTQTPKAAKKMRSAVGRLSRISARAARGQLGLVNFELSSFADPDTAESFAERISQPDSEIFPIPSSITHKLHDPHLTALDGFARRSLVSGLNTLVTGVTYQGSSKRYYTVRLVGIARLNQPNSNTEPSN